MFYKQFAIMRFASYKLVAFVTKNGVMNGCIWACKSNVLLSISMIAIVHDFLLGWLFIVQ